jgi:uncharacterized membrane protein
MAINKTFRRPSLRSCLLGSVVGLIVYIISWYIILAFPYIVNLLAVPFLFIPDRLGFVEYVTREDVIALTVPVEYEFELPRAGEYFIFSTNLLPAANRVLVKSKEANNQIEVSYIIDAVNPYGTSVVEGRPVFEFKVEQPGTYVLYLQDLPDNAEPEYTLFIVPDVSARNRRILIVSFLVYISVIAFVGGQIYHRRNKERIQQEKMARNAKREKFEAWIKKQREG